MHQVAKSSFIAKNYNMLLGLKILVLFSDIVNAKSYFFQEKEIAP
jgi:hypothetical protein